VPAECFRRGTLIRIVTNGPTNSTILRVSIGGDGTAVAAGVVALNFTGPAAAAAGLFTLQQETDGLAPTFRATGVWSGATSLEATTATATVFIQPLNFVELSTGGTFTIDHASIEVLPAHDVVFAGYQEILAT
jgi:hypothetical protein